MLVDSLPRKLKMSSPFLGTIKKCLVSDTRQVRQQPKSLKDLEECGKEYRSLENEKQKEKKGIFQIFIIYSIMDDFMFLWGPEGWQYCRSNQEHSAVCPLYQVLTLYRCVLACLPLANIFSFAFVVEFLFNHDYLETITKLSPIINCQPNKGKFMRGGCYRQESICAEAHVHDKTWKAYFTFRKNTV